MEKSEQENGGARTAKPVAAEDDESKALADSLPADLRTWQEDIEATVRESRAALEASGKVLADLDVSGAQFDRVVRELEREVERALGLLKSGRLSAEATGQVTALLDEVLPEWFLRQGKVRMAALAALGDGEDAGPAGASPGRKPGKASLRRGRTAV